jgi:hypothetical protein
MGRSGSGRRRCGGSMGRSGSGRRRCGRSSRRGRRWCGGRRGRCRAGRARRCRRGCRCRGNGRCEGRHRTVTATTTAGQQRATCREPDHDWDERQIGSCGSTIHLALRTGGPLALGKFPVLVGINPHPRAVPAHCTITRVRASAVLVRLLRNAQGVEQRFTNVWPHRIHGLCAMWGAKSLLSHSLSP